MTFQLCIFVCSDCPQCFGVNIKKKIRKQKQNLISMSTVFRCQCVFGHPSITQLECPPTHPSQQVPTPRASFQPFFIFLKKKKKKTEMVLLMIHLVRVCHNLDSQKVKKNKFLTCWGLSYESCWHFWHPNATHFWFRLHSICSHTLYVSLLGLDVFQILHKLTRTAN